VGSPSIVIYEPFWFFRAEGYDKEDIERVVRSVVDSRRRKIIGDRGEFMKNF